MLLVSKPVNAFSYWKVGFVFIFVTIHPFTYFHVTEMYI